MPIPQIHGAALAQKKEINVSFTAGDQNGQGQLNEDQRRRTSAVAQTVTAPTTTSAPAAGATGQAGSAGATGATGAKGDKGDTGPPGPVIDRLHKEYGSIYGGIVFVGHDHDPSEYVDQTPPTNPGWRSPDVLASSLNDAYAKALIITEIPGFQADARVAIYVLGGVWNEALICTSDRIDLIGFGRPKINGRIIVTETATVFRMDNFEVVNDVFTEGPANPSITVVAAPVINLPYSSIQFRNVWAHNPQRAFVTYRRVYCEDCWFWSDTVFDLSLEMAALEIYASADDVDWSIFSNCNVWGYTELVNVTDGRVPPPGGRNSFGYAVKASSKVDGTYLPFGDFIGGLTQQDGSYYTMPHSGAFFTKCQIHGLLLCDTWTVKIAGSQCVSAQPNSVLAQPPYGGAFAVIRGLGPVIAEDPPIQAHIPGRIFWDHSEVLASFVAVFVCDESGWTPPFGTANPWAGAAHFRHSEHLCQYTQIDGSGQPAFIGYSAPGQVFHDNFSSTFCDFWCSDGYTTALPDATTGCGQLVAAVYDPYLL